MAKRILTLLAVLLMVASIPVVLGADANGKENEEKVALDKVPAEILKAAAEAVKVFREVAVHHRVSETSRKMDVSSSSESKRSTPNAMLRRRSILSSGSAPEVKDRNLPVRSSSEGGVAHRAPWASPLYTVPSRIVIEILQPRTPKGPSPYSLWRVTLILLPSSKYLSSLRLHSSKADGGSSPLYKA